ncbi:MAG: response regulator [Herpetosiphonaceae bacterium]|nr:response regulator [Herpetosiphonaceae bacterium]
MVVLVVDDEDTIVQLLSDILSDEGLEVETALDGRIALKKLRGGLRPGLMISDVMMPGLDGWGLYRALRYELELGSIGVILMSAGRNRPQHLDDPATRFITKPFDVADVLEAVEELRPH